MQTVSKPVKVAKEYDYGVPENKNESMINDPWAHRGIGMKCKTCMWFVSKGEPLLGVGRCRRHSPSMNGYPVVYITDWCGDHKVNEEAI